MAKYGEKRPEHVNAKIFVARMCGITEEKGGYDVMGYWDDLMVYQGADTYFKLERLRAAGLAPSVYNDILSILQRDDEDNPLEEGK